MTNTSFGLSMVPEWQNPGNFVWVFDLGFVVLRGLVSTNYTWITRRQLFSSLERSCYDVPSKTQKMCYAEKKTENMSGHC